jgi:alpha-mannosidase
VARQFGPHFGRGRGGRGATANFLALDPENVELSALYPGETEGSIILRVWETMGKTAALTFRGPLGRANSATRVDLMERPIEAMADRPGSWSLQLRPWEIASVRLADWD